MTVATLSNQKTMVRLRYCLQRRNVNDEKYIKKKKKKITIPYQWRFNNVKEQGFNSDILIIDSKTTE